MSFQPKKAIKVVSLTQADDFALDEAQSTQIDRACEALPRAEIAADLNAEQYSLLFQNMPLGIVEEDFSEVKKEVDVLISATSPTTAFKFGENTDDPLKMYLADALTIAANVAGICGLGRKFASFAADYINGDDCR